MAIIANSTIVSVVAENINSEWIAQTVRVSLNRIPLSYPLGSKEVSLVGKNTATYSHPIRDEIAAATSHTETDLVASTPITRTDTTVSVGTDVKGTFISYEAARQSMWGEFTNATQELVGACQRKIDNDFLALATSFTNTIGDAATNNNVDNLVTTLTTWRAQVASTSGSPVMIMHPDAMRDLQQDAVTNASALFGTVVGVQLHETVNGLNQGVAGTFNNVLMTTSANVPVGDTTGWSNFMVATGDNDCAIAKPFDQTVMVELSHKPERLGWYVIASVSFGVGIVNDDAGLVFISRT